MTSVKRAEINQIPAHVSCEILAYLVPLGKATPRVPIDAWVPVLEDSRGRVVVAVHMAWMVGAPHDGDIFAIGVPLVVLQLLAEIIDHRIHIAGDATRVIGRMGAMIHDSDIGFEAKQLGGEVPKDVVFRARDGNLVRTPAAALVNHRHERVPSLRDGRVPNKHHCAVS